LDTLSYVLVVVQTMRTLIPAGRVGILGL